MRMTKNNFSLMVAMILVAGFAAPSWGHRLGSPSPPHNVGPFAWTGGNGSEWSDANGGLWNPNFGLGPNGSPDCHDGSTFNGNRTVYIGTDVSWILQDIRINNGPARTPGTALVITNGSYSMQTPFDRCHPGDATKGFIAVQWQAGGAATLGVEGGTLHAGDLRVAAGASGTLGDGTKGTVYVSGGSLTFFDGYLGKYGNTRGDATFRVEGTGGTIQGDSLLATDTSTVEFQLDATGVSSIDIGGLVTVWNGAALVVDGSVYTGGPALIELVNFGTLNGQFNPADISIVGFADLSARIQYDGDSINLLLTSGSPIIGPFVRNGHFEEDAVAGTRSYDETTYWENIGGSQSLDARDDSITVASGHCLLTTSAAGRIAAQDTGYTLREGDEFSVSFEWQDGANWEAADDQIQVSLFVTDDDTIAGTQTVLTNLLSGISGTPLATQSSAVISQLTPIAFAGKRLFVSIDVFSGNGDADDEACVDDFTLNVTNRVDIPTLSEWGMILLFAGLLFFAYRKLSRQQAQPAGVGASGGAPA